MTRPLLTVCIASLHSRTLQLAECLTSLRPGRALASKIEILVSMDQGQTPLGTKRNRQVHEAAGVFIAHVDDDDIVSPGYVYKIISAIEEYPTADAILVRGRRIEYPGGSDALANGRSGMVEFDYRLGGVEGEWSMVDNTTIPIIWRSPGHVCPIRAELIKETPFDDIPTDEDLVWAARLAPKLKSAVRAGKPGEILYEYRWRPGKEFGT